MPTYEYICPLCQGKQKIIRSIHEDDPGYDCVNCKVPMNQVLGSPALSFKGGGWAHKS